VDIKMTARGSGDTASQLVQTLEEIILGKIGEHVYGKDGETLEEVVGRLLFRGKLTLSVAESCTGGLIEHRITDVPGSSEYFFGGIVAYRNDLKEKLLGVPKEILEGYGAVSRETATHMAEGVRRLLRSDIGIGTTGIAGPAGATPSKPVGLVYIGLSASGSTLVEEHIFRGGRAGVKEQSAQASLDMLRRYLSSC
jgi:nicotinamide-nucleotide amidase